MANVITTTNSQATPAGNIPVYQSSQVNSSTINSNSASDVTISTPKTQAGASAAPDDNTATQTNATGSGTNSSGTGTTGTSNLEQPIIPQPNVLDKYVSYTYSVSWYLMTPTQAKELSQIGIQNISNWQLLIQSGGIPVQDRNTLDPNKQIFSKDYYFDNLEIKSVFTGKGTASAHNAAEMSWTITEPNGLTLLNNLYAAVVNLYKKENIENPNYVNATYCLVIKFYGYDEQGNLVPVGKQGTNGNVNLTDPTAVVTKFYPIRIANITFKLANKQVEYKIEAVPIPYSINRGTFRGTIPYNYELVGNTLQDVLIGKTTNAQTVAASETTRDNNNTQPVTVPDAPSKAPSAPGASTNNVFIGLCEALNTHQKLLVKQGTYEHADVYSIEFASSSLSSATLRKPNGTNFSVTPMQQASTGSKQLNPNTNSVELQGRTVPVQAGKQIIQFLEEQIRASSYITDQLSYVTSEVTGQQAPTTSNSKQPTVWYKISFVAVPGSYDNKRRDFAYNIKYVISPFAIPAMQSEYASGGKFRGVHKEYKYWFTGENTQVLDYSQDLNALYAVVMSGKQAFNAEKVTGRDQIQKTFMAASGQSNQGAANNANEPAANLADYLYSYADLGKVNLKIIGDPAWLQQGEAAGVITKPISLAPFNNDGTINFDASQICFKIMWNAPTDYNFETGLVEVNSAVAQTGTSNTPQEYAYYTATECRSSFSKGRFEQTLEGALIPPQVISAGNAISSGATTSTSGGSTGTTGNQITTSGAPLTAAAAADQLGIPNLGTLFNNVGNAVTNYIRNPLQNILPEGRINQPAPNSTEIVAPATSLQSPITPASTPQPATSNGVVNEAALQNLISWPKVNLQSLFAASTPGAATSVAYPAPLNPTDISTTVPGTIVVPSSGVNQVMAKEP